MRSQSNSTGEQRRAPTPFGRRSSGCTVRKKRSSRRANYGVNRIPDCIDEWNLVGEKFDDVERDRNPENPGMRQHLQLLGQMDNAEALQQAQRAYHRTIAGSAFANPTEGPTAIELQRESLDEVEAARLRLQFPEPAPTFAQSGIKEK